MEFGRVFVAVLTHSLWLKPKHASPQPTSHCRIPARTQAYLASTAAWRDLAGRFLAEPASLSSHAYLAARHFNCPERSDTWLRVGVKFRGYLSRRHDSAHGSRRIGCRLVRRYCRLGNETAHRSGYGGGFRIDELVGLPCASSWRPYRSRFSFFLDGCVPRALSGLGAIPSGDSLYRSPPRGC